MYAVNIKTLRNNGLGILVDSMPENYNWSDERTILSDSSIKRFIREFNTEDAITIFYKGCLKSPIYCLAGRIYRRLLNIFKEEVLAGNIEYKYHSDVNIKHLCYPNRIATRAANKLIMYGVIRIDDLKYLSPVDVVICGISKGELNALLSEVSSWCINGEVERLL